MKKIICLIIIGMSFYTSFAQDNSETILEENKVIGIKKFLYVHAFIDNYDTCLVNTKEYNKNLNLTYEMNDMSCMGWKDLNETVLSYNKKRLDNVLAKLNGKVDSKTSYEYVKKQKEPFNATTVYIETADTLVVETKYFKSGDDRIDSTHSTVWQPDGVVVKTKTFAKYNERNDLIQYYTLAEAGNPLNMISYDIDSAGLLQSVSHTTYGEKSNFMQIFYEYDSEGRILSTMNTTEQKQEYFYHKNGLIRNVYSYNPKGKLEMEYLFEYTYLK